MLILSFIFFVDIQLPTLCNTFPRSLVHNEWSGTISNPGLTKYDEDEEIEWLITGLLCIILYREKGFFFFKGDDPRV